jgi:hypothetical protein
MGSRPGFVNGDAIEPLLVELLTDFSAVWADDAERASAVENESASSIDERVMLWVEMKCSKYGVRGVRLGG